MITTAISTAEGACDAAGAAATVQGNLAAHANLTTTAHGGIVAMLLGFGNILVLSFFTSNPAVPAGATVAKPVAPIEQAAPATATHALNLTAESAQRN